MRTDAQVPLCLYLCLCFVCTNSLLLCYNCTSTHQDWRQLHCGGDFIHTIFPINMSQMQIINCTTENAMCFVRTWSARSRHAWVVQRGCYSAPGGTADLQIPTLNSLQPAMACKNERYPDAEYRMCICAGNWCNSASILAEPNFALRAAVVLSLASALAFTHHNFWCNMF